MVQQKLIDLMIENVEKFNKINNDLKRYAIFNTFVIHYSITSSKINVDIMNTDGMSEEEVNLTSIGIETFIEIDMQNEAELAWAIKTLDRFLLKTNESMDKARQLAKPQVGILVYDEFTDSYFLNPTTGPILLKSKEISGAIASTRLDMFGVLINLRNAIIGQNYGGDVLGESAQTIETAIDESIKTLQKESDKLDRIEGIPKWILHLEKDDKFFNLSGYITDNNSKLDIGVVKRVNEFEASADFEDLDALTELYSKARSCEEINNGMSQLARQLITKSDPKMFIQDNTTKMWLATKEGKELMANMNIIEFLNNDLTSIELNLR